MGKEWTEEETTFLKFSYPNKDFTVKEICVALDRGKGSISRRASKLGLYRPQPEILPYGFKKCSKCDVIAPLNEFYKSSRSKDGRDSWCKYCKSKKTDKGALSEKQTRCNSNTKGALSEKSKTCNICHQVRLLNDFPKNKKSKDGYENQCKICRSHLNRKRYIKGAY